MAQFDTGTNPFHPCFRAPGADPTVIDGIGAFETLRLTFGADYASSLAASQGELQRIEPGTLYHVAGTRILFYGTATELVDDYPHGSQASSQIVCEEFGMAPDAWLVVLNWYDESSHVVGYLEWVAAQDWIDIVHLNIQDTPIPAPSTRTEAIANLIASDKFVVIAAGNGAGGLAPSYPMELSSYNGPPGSLIVGASAAAGPAGWDGYSYYSNLNPHVAMDACGTAAADPESFGQTTFSGTSSASPRTTGYVAHLLQVLRDRFDPNVTHDSALLEIPTDAAPAEGPLSDGALTVAELHAVVRKTADPNPHTSQYDGEGCFGVPQPVDLPMANYAKMGYGEVSEVTVPAALAVLLGEAPLPDRDEDVFYDASETIRETYWG